MPVYTLGATSCDTDHPDAQIILSDACKRHLRPLCPCSLPHPEMYIAHVDGACVVKRMPNSALRHHPLRKDQNADPSHS
jgi:hypothetical protein